MELDLLEKTEIWIENIKLKDANLNEVGQVVASALGLRRREVIVTDVRENHIILDVLSKTIRAECVFGRKNALLKELSKVPGVTISKETTIHSEGILGFISLDERRAKEVVKSSGQMVKEIKRKIARRATVFSTGCEIEQGIIRDTNTPMIAERLRKEGYQVAEGETLDDDEGSIASSIWNAVNSGFGLIIITGGVGAEDKDRTVEGILSVDPHAAVANIVNFEVGVGRHVKDSVKIAVGELSKTMIISLPGPNDEAKLGLDAVIKGLSQGLSKNALADKVAETLKNRLRESMGYSLS
jgi:molybdenum cofactor synthesis domain-containing protein